MRRGVRHRFRDDVIGGTFDRFSDPSWDRLSCRGWASWWSGALRQPRPRGPRVEAQGADAAERVAAIREQREPAPATEPEAQVAAEAAERELSDTRAALQAAVYAKARPGDVADLDALYQAPDARR